MSNQSSILETLTEQYNDLTKSSKKIAQYIFENAQEAQYISITNLAEECEVAEATITRFCRQLGFSGYNDFKLALAKSETTTTVNDDLGLNGAISKTPFP